MATKAFCPAYITGIFSIQDDDAAGAGFALDKGMATTVELKREGRVKVLMNGSESPAPVSKAVMRKYSEKSGRLGIVEIRHESEIPSGFGLGMSAAGALSLSLAMNEALGMGLKDEECVKIAHDAEIECRTGLSGADAAFLGGMVVRKDIESPPKKIPFEEKEIEIAFFAPVRNVNITASDEWKQRINKAATPALAKLSEVNSWKAFLDCSRYFASESGLASWCREEMKTNARASMAMLGQTLFSDKKMLLQKNPAKVLTFKTYEGGAQLQ